MTIKFKIGDLISNPDYLLYGINPARSELIFLEVTRETYRNSTFLDERISRTRDRVHGFDLEEVVNAMSQVPTRSKPVHYIFHTAFCCSTLLAKSLDFEDRTMSLREPMVFTNLANAKRILKKKDQFDTEYWQNMVNISVKLLNKVYNPEEQVIVKATNMANNVAADALNVNRDSKAILLTSSLESYIASNIKKKDEALEKIPLIAKFFSMDSDYIDHFPELKLPDLDFLQRIIFAWHIQRYMFMQLVENFGQNRVRTMDADELLDRPFDSLQAARDFLDLDIPDKMLREKIGSNVWHRDAKSPEKPFNRTVRAADYAEILDHNRTLIDDAIGWSAMLQDGVPVADPLPSPLLG